MFKPTPAFNWSTTIFVVLIVQLITIGMLTTSLLTEGVGAMGTISQLPPLNFIYNAADISWIGAGRAISHIITFIMNMITGALCIWYGTSRNHEISRILSITLGLGFFIDAATQITFAGVISYGGWWHIAGLLVTMLNAIAATGSAVVIALVASHFVRFKSKETKDAA